jgi:hypothetical protein
MRKQLEILGLPSSGVAAMITVKAGTNCFGRFNTQSFIPYEAPITDHSQPSRANDVARVAHFGEPAGKRIGCG